MRGMNLGPWRPSQTYHFVLYEVTNYFVVEVIYGSPTYSFLNVFLLPYRNEGSEKLPKELQGSPC